MDHLVIRLAQQLHDFRRQKVSILLQEIGGTVRYTASVVLHSEAQAVGLGRYVKIRSQVLLEFLCRFNIKELLDC